MPKTLLAVDDSATMRKVLEITFSGEDFRVAGADGASGALARLSEDPAAAVIDASLGSDDGYALAKELRSRSGRLAIVLLASRHSPYDPARGRDAGIDDFIDKPFDTQALIDKVKKALMARESGRAATPVAAAQTTASFGASPPRPPPPAAPAAAAKPAWPTQRTHTLSFEGAAPSAPAAPVPAHAALSRTSPSGVAFAPGSSAAQPAAPPPASAPAAHAPQPALAAPPRAAAPAATAARVVTAENGRLAGKLDELGLTSQQVDAVLALSREIVERVVWEVVPQLAETLIKEEIARLTREPE